MAQTIDTTTARRMAEAGTILGAAIIGQPGGWSVMLKMGMTEKPLGAVKTDRPRMWRSVDTLLAYLRKDLHIVRVDGIDATHHSAADAAWHSRPDTAARMKRAHEAAEHDAWFREQVDQAIKEADNPKTKWVSQADAMADMHRHLDKLEKQATAKAKVHA